MHANVDISGVSHKALRGRLVQFLNELEIPVQSDLGFWSTFPQTSARPGSVHTLVLCDLSTLTRQFRNAQPQLWTTSVRTLHPYFLALVRTQQDRRFIEWVDDIVKASDMRLEVCYKTTDWDELTRCLFSILGNLAPDSVSSARYSAFEDRFWVEFGDGLNGTWTWHDLQLEFLKGHVLPESVAPSPSGSSIELLRTNGDIYDIDAGVLRAVFDNRFRDVLSKTASEQRQSFGKRLKFVRTSLGLTQTQLGERSDLDQAVISRIEKGKVRPRIDTLARIARSVDMSVSDLLEAGT